MYRGFNLLLEDNFFNRDSFKTLQEIGSESISHQKAKVIEKISSFANEDNSLDGSKMQENWFPQIEADIFISHSHKDEKLAIALAGWLQETFGLTAFIDSCVWGYANKLLKKIDDIYCLNDGGHTYNYKKRNYSTSHVHMMLSVALTQMIDNTECLFFLNTPNSLTPNPDRNQTESPWIYSEISTSQLIRKKKLEEYRQVALTESQRIFAEDGNLKVQYDLPIDHLTDIDAGYLYKWLEVWNEDRNKGLQNSKNFALDNLYKLTK